MVYVSDEPKEVIIKGHIKKGRIYRSLSAEYGCSIRVISDWVGKFRKECQENQYKKENLGLMEENRKLKGDLDETRKEAEFLKKWRHSLRRRAERNTGSSICMGRNSG
ncbi:Uncharacterised protein [uncultured Eubacterium sp.]|nr:Uncharacterised protein [uncultured Eubacterium sp.]